MSLTIVVTNYLRPANVLRILDAAAGQTVNATIFVWDNSPAQDFDDPRVDWLIRSSKNARCSARWWMASHATTDFVLVHDDDLLPSEPGVFARTLEAAARQAPFAVGASGVALRDGRGYWQSRHVGVRAHHLRRDVSVDIVKGFFFCCPRVQLARVGYLDLDGEDDIVVSSKLARGVARPHLVLARLRADLALLPEPGARKDRACHRPAREAARRRFFPNA